MNANKPVDDFIIGDRVRFVCDPHSPNCNDGRIALVTEIIDRGPKIEPLYCLFGIEGGGAYIGRVPKANIVRDAPFDDAWSGASDRPLPEDAKIRDAFPTRSGRHDLYAEAMRLVGARYTKRGLVALVNWLLHRIETERTAGAKRCQPGTNG